VRVEGARAGENNTKSSYITLILSVNVRPAPENLQTFGNKRPRAKSFLGAIANDRVQARPGRKINLPTMT
jgi:hypothetical protein